jgi:D-3-phosphoglycerate dehydrogenase
MMQRYLGEPVPDLYENNPLADVTWNLDGESPYKDFQGSELCESTLGLVGFGNIGIRVAQLARAFGMRVIVYSPYHGAEKSSSPDVRCVSFDELLKESDYISIHCKATPETEKMFSRREFALMKRGAYLINTARAVIVDQQALIEALQEKRIAGAALDVYWCEPIPCNSPLLQLDNVTLTPHLAGATVEVAERHSKMLVDGVLDWLDGRQPKFVYHKE